MTAQPVPAWLSDLQAEADAHPVERLAAPLRRPPLEVDESRMRRAAVLVLVGPEGVVLTRRASRMSSHAGQVSFPGGGIDAGESPQEAALREAWEEVGLEPPSAEVVATLPELPVAPSFRPVTPVVAWWREPHRVGVVSEQEVASVHVVPLEDLVAPAARFSARLPGSTFRTPGFEADGIFVWGYTGWLLSTVLRLGGVDRPWDPQVVREVPEGYR
ncbi:ADP-ribose pyrophosphatase YjhB, NUDIX family [Kytococcus aerolatus]|uniref:ADP-ribose pyrophosphatase YjhB, NUDIX family n=1 Tax=Kytococcus aerolatus TaxID=592308 RepID=A0A212U6H4_9MICO|nr:CoA pyrophosphatase [Kytococcus aerolatus]SNC73829.1 ADP-ribose pyrophosphatase YjhB, NUDIX family [Kytococcus aerolatus]